MHAIKFAKLILAIIYSLTSASLLYQVHLAFMYCLQRVLLLLSTNPAMCGGGVYFQLQDEELSK